MIKELHLKNWKSFGDTILYIEPVTVLMGLNASGKSNAIDALLFLQRSINKRTTQKLQINYSPMVAM